MFKTHMREALSSMDLQKVQELRTFFEKVEQALPAQQAPEQEPFLGKTADVVYDPNQLHTPEHIPQPAMQPLENEVRDPGVIKCACGNVMAPGQEFCPSCGTHKGVMQQNPLEWPIAKTAELADEPQASQPGMNQPDNQAMPMPTAPNPAAMGDQDPKTKIVQNPGDLARQEIADEAAATTFSVLDNLESKDQVIQSLSEAYGVDPQQVASSLAVQATFGDVIAINGDVTKVDINRTEFEEVNPASVGEGGGMPEDDFSQGIVPPPAPENEHNSLTKVEKAAKVPLQLIINKLMQEQNVSEQDANQMLKDNTWGDIPIPMEFNVPVHGELKFFLPKEMVGTQQVTENPFQTDQRPEDYMDQEFNNVPSLPGH